MRTPSQIIKRKMAFFGHACRNNKCNPVKTCILGMMSGKRRRGRPRMLYIDNIKKWTRASLEENVRLLLKIEQHGGKEVVQLERQTSELTTPTKVK